MKTWKTWTRKEDALLEGLREHGLTLGQIAARLGRTSSSIDNRREPQCFPKILANDVSWPKTATPPGIHRHLYDMTGLYYWPCDRRITTPDGTARHITTEAGRIQ